jgi:phage-related protein
MALLSTLTSGLAAETGFVSPRQIPGMISGAITESFQQVRENIKPDAMVKNLIRETGLSDIIPTFSFGLDRLFDQSTAEAAEEKKRAAEEKKRAAEEKKAAAAAANSSNSVLEGIKNVLDDTYEIIASRDVETAEQIAERRRLTGEATPAGPPAPGPVPVGDSSLGGIFGFFGKIAKVIGGAGGLAAAGLGLTRLGSLFSFLGKLALKAGPIGAILSMAISLDGTDWTNLVEGVKESFEKIKNGEYLEGVKQLIMTPINFAVTAYKKTVDSLSEWIESFGIDEGMSDLLANLALGGTLIIGFRKSILTVVRSIRTIARIASRLFVPLTVVITLFETIKGTIDGWKEDGFVGALKGAITEFGATLIAVPLDFIKGIVAWALEKLGFDKTAEALNDFSFEDIWRNTVSAFFEGVKSMVEWVKLKFSDTTEAIGNLWTSLVGAGKNLVDFLWTPIESAINWVKVKFTDITEVIESLWASLVGAGKDLVSLLWSPIESAINWVKTLFTDPVEAFKQYFSTLIGVYSSIGELLFAPVESAINWVKVKFSDTTEAIGNLWTNLVGAGKGLVSLLWSPIESAINWVKVKFSDTTEAIGNLWTNLVGAGKGLVSLLWSPIESAINWVKTLFTDPVKAFKQYFSAMIGVYSSIGALLFVPIGSAMTWIKDTFSDIKIEVPEWMKDIGGYLKDKLVKPIADFFEMITNFDFASLVPDWVKDLFGGPTTEVEPLDMLGGGATDTGAAMATRDVATMSDEELVKQIENNKRILEIQLSKPVQNEVFIGNLNRQIDQLTSLQANKESLQAVQVTSSKSLADYNEAMENMKRDMEERERRREQAASVQPPIVVNNNNVQQGGNGGTAPVGPLHTRPTESRLDDMLLGGSLGIP